MNERPETSPRSLNKIFYFNNKDTRKDKKNFQNVFDEEINFTFKYKCSSQ